MGRATLRARGQMTLPADVRTALGVEDGDELEFEVTTSGTVVVRGFKLIPSDQAWFWTESWQRGEREADEDLATGQFTRCDDDEILFKSLG